MALVGYLCDEVGLPPVRQLKVKAETYRVRSFEETSQVFSVSLPAYFHGVCLYKPRITPYNVEGSLRKRLFHLPPQVTDLGVRARMYPHIPDPTLDGILKRPSRHALYRRLRKYVWSWCHEHLKPLDHIMTFDEALGKTHYSKSRKDMLRRAAGDASRSSFSNYVVKCFVKDEFYEEPKFPRMISSREDRAKVLLMAVFKAIEEEVFALPYFVKHMTTQQRIEKISSLFDDRDVYVTDYSAFETHFTPALMCNLEMVMYRYMLKNFPDEYQLIRKLAGENKLRSKYFTGSLQGVRMSGEMNTSLGNGFSNLLLMSFACYMTGNRILGCVVEGDDGLFETERPLQQEFFKDMGLELKCAKTKAWKASFCGCVYNPVSLHNLGHPIKALIKSCWSSKFEASSSESHLRELQVAKVMSLNAEHPGVPIVWKFCQMVFERLGTIKYCRAWKYYDVYQREHLQLSDKVVAPTPDDRAFFQEMEGITIRDQVRIEEDIEKTFPFVCSPTFNSYVPDTYLDAWEEYVRPYDEVMPKSLVGACHSPRVGGPGVRGVKRETQVNTSQPLASLRKMFRRHG